VEPAADPEKSGQGWHADAPRAFWNDPAGQAVHAPPSGPLWPGSHVQDDDADEPEGLEDDDGHDAHAAAPIASLNEPSSHATHSTTSPV